MPNMNGLAEAEDAVRDALIWIDGRSCAGAALAVAPINDHNMTTANAVEMAGAPRRKKGLRCTRTALYRRRASRA
jgi:hypothetical protein